jgi:hypothetical protein
MANKKRTETAAKTQHEKFVEAAREIDCDDDEGRFKERFKKLTEASPPASVEKRKRRTKI